MFCPHALLCAALRCAVILKGAQEWHWLLVMAISVAGAIAAALMGLPDSPRLVALKSTPIGTVG